MYPRRDKEPKKSSECVGCKYADEELHSDRGMQKEERSNNHERKEEEVWKDKDRNDRNIFIEPSAPIMLRGTAKQKIE